MPVARRERPPALKLFQIVTRLQRRGAEVFACQLGDELAARGHDVTLAGLYTAIPGELVPRRARALDLGGSRRLVTDRDLVRRLAGELDARPPDLVQANGSDTLTYASLVRRRLGASWPLVYRNIGIPSTWARHLHQRLRVRWVLRGVDRIASVSAASARDFEATYGVPADRIVTIPRGIPCPELEPRAERRARLAAEAGLDADTAVLVHVGSFTPEKNHMWLLDAFAEIARRRPDARLVLIGEGPLAPRVRAAIAQRGMSSRVRMLGSRADAADLAGGGDVFVLPSLTEGLPGVVLEAGAREVPSVAADVGGVAEAIDEGRTGHLVPSGDRTSFVDRIVDLLDDPERARRMGLAARERVCSRFGLARAADAFESLYRELVP